MEKVTVTKIQHQGFDMALKILNTISPGAQLGQMIGTGLGGALEELAQMKANQLMEHNKGQGLQALRFSPEEAGPLSKLPNELLLPLIKQKALEPLYRGEAELYAQLTGQPAPDMQNIPGIQQPQQPGMQETQGPSQIQAPFPAMLQPGKAIPLAQFQQQKKIGEEKLAMQKSKDVREFSKPYIEKAEAARANIRDYDQLIKLAESGKLRAGNMAVLLDKVGLTGLNRNYETQVADKLVARLAQNARVAFGSGSRITNYLEQVFQRSLPTLFNTPEGIVAVSKLNKLADEASIIKDDARKQIIKESKGLIPPDIDDLISQRAQPLIAPLEEQALAIASNPVKSQQKTFAVNQTLDTLPSAADNPGMELEADNGEILVSKNGAWVKKGR